MCADCLAQTQGTAGNELGGRADGAGHCCALLSYPRRYCGSVDLRWNLAQISSPGKITDAFSSLAKRSNFRAISKKLNLIPRVDGEYDLKVPRDMAYVFSGAYVPLSCRIIEQVLDRRSWQGLDEVVRLLNCSEFAFTDTAKEDKASSESLRLILVVFLGGCTFSEISALRFLGREKGYRFIFLTTAVTNSARLMEAMSEVKS